MATTSSDSPYLQPLFSRPGSDLYIFGAGGSPRELGDIPRALGKVLSPGQGHTSLPQKHLAGEFPPFSCCLLSPRWVLLVPATVAGAAPIWGPDLAAGRSRSRWPTGALGTQTDVESQHHAGLKGLWHKSGLISTNIAQG